MNAWHLITRLGEAQLLLPAALLVGWLLATRPEGRAAAWRWLAGLLVATALTTATKVAFIGWGVGSARWNFTGISGHAMYASAIYPVLLAGCATLLTGRGRVAGAVLGALLALVVGWSRLAVEAHSPSEVVAGLLLGGLVSAEVLVSRHWHPPRLQPWVPAVALVGLVVWLGSSAAWAPPSATHALVTRLSLKLSGHPHPFTRAQLLRNAQAGARLQRVASA